LSWIQPYGLEYEQLFVFFAAASAKKKGWRSHPLRENPEKDFSRSGYFPIKSLPDEKI
jgi:hypothetical protein